MPRRTVLGFTPNNFELPSGRLVCTVSRTTKGLAVTGEKGTQLDWDTLEVELTEWLSLRLAEEEVDVTRSLGL